MLNKYSIKVVQAAGKRRNETADELASTFHIGGQSENIATLWQICKNIRPGLFVDYQWPPWDRHTSISSCHFGIIARFSQVSSRLLRDYSMNRNPFRVLQEPSTLSRTERSGILTQILQYSSDVEGSANAGGNCCKHFFKEWKSLIEGGGGGGRWSLTSRKWMAARQRQIQRKSAIKQQ